MSDLARYSQKLLRNFFRPYIHCIGVACALFCILSFGTPKHTQEHNSSSFVSIYLWAEGIPDDVYQEFTKETGIKVRHASFDSNEMLYTRLKTQGSENFDIDVIMPSTYFVDKMIQEDLLLALDKSQLPHFHGLNKAFLNKPYDPQNRYSIPNTIGATGIGMNKKFIKGSITSWQQLWDPRFKNALLLIDDAREVFHIALLTLGYSPNTTDKKEIYNAYEKLLQLAPNIKTFNSDNPSEPFLTGDVNIGMLWNGSTITAQREDPNITMIFPTEGAVFWADNFAIPKYAQNPQNAHKLINFLCRPDIAARTSIKTGYPTPVLKSYQYLPERMRLDPIFMLPESVIAKGVFQSDVGHHSQLYEYYYQQFKIAVSGTR